MRAVHRCLEVLRLFRIMFLNVLDMMTSNNCSTCADCNNTGGCSTVKMLVHAKFLSVTVTCPYNSKELIYFKASNYLVRVF